MNHGLSAAHARLHLLDALAALPPAPATPRPVLLAVSGGPDSLALLLLAAENRDRIGAAGFALAVATVDHGLRRGSCDEAGFVARLARDLDLPHRTLVWEGVKPGANLAAAARDARYELLADHARALGAAAVITAHHEDDQIETHHLAAHRRAGDRGLAGMRMGRALAPGLWLLRPFLGVPGAELKAAVAARGLAPVDDPANRDARFARARLRAALPLDPRARRDTLSRIAVHAARRDAEDAALGRMLRAFRRDGTLSVDGCGTVRLGRPAFGALDEDLADALLARTLRAAGGAPYAPPRAAVQRLRRGVREGSLVGATLGGAAAKAGDTLVFHREYGRGGPADQVLGDARAVLFDRRMTVRRPDGPGGRLLLRAFGRTGRGNAVEKTLPVVTNEAGSIVAAPADLLRKVPDTVARLAISEDVSFRLWADLPDAGIP